MFCLNSYILYQHNSNKEWLLYARSLDRLLDQTDYWIKGLGLNAVIHHKPENSELCILLSWLVYILLVQRIIMIVICLHQTSASLVLRLILFIVFIFVLSLFNENSILYVNIAVELGNLIASLFFNEVHFPCFYKGAVLFELTDFNPQVFLIPSQVYLDSAFSENEFFAFQLILLNLNSINFLNHMISRQKSIFNISVDC